MLDLDVLYIVSHVQFQFLQTNKQTNKQAKKPAGLGDSSVNSPAAGSRAKGEGEI